MHLELLLQLMPLLVPVAQRDWRPVTSWDPPSTLERRIIDRALGCRRMRRSRKADPLFLLDMLRLEESAAVPRSLRGMILAAACSESGFEPDARGDHKKGKPKAIGVLQLWPWWERHYGISRLNPMQSGEAWLTHILVQKDKAKRRCGRRLRGERLWTTAWIRAVRAPHPTGRCGQTPKHYVRLNQWRRSWWRLVL